MATEHKCCRVVFLLKGTPRRWWYRRKRVSERERLVYKLTRTFSPKFDVWRELVWRDSKDRWSRLLSLLAFLFSFWLLFPLSLLQGIWWLNKRYIFLEEHHQLPLLMKHMVYTRREGKCQQSWCNKQMFLLRRLIRSCLAMRGVKRVKHGLMSSSL